MEVGGEGDIHSLPYNYTVSVCCDWEDLTIRQHGDVCV